MGGLTLADENAEFLAIIASRGTDLSAPSKVAFAHLLYSKFSAAQFKRVAEREGYSLEVKPFPRFDDEGPDEWDVVASIEMVPSVEEITRRERELGALARQFGGGAD